MAVAKKPSFSKKDLLAYAKSGVTVIKKVVEGRRIKGFECKNKEGQPMFLSKDQVAYLIDKKKMTNVVKQVYQGTVIIREKKAKAAPAK